jgi:hypothetical protein
LRPELRGTIVFPPELEREAYRISNGEFGWTRGQIPKVVEIVRSRQLAILGGELWWVGEGIPNRAGVPQRSGPPGVYCWATEREIWESWPSYVERCASESLDAARRWPAPDDLPLDLPGQILYNLCWVSEDKYKTLKLNRPPLNYPPR